MVVLGFGAFVANALSNAASGHPPWQPLQLPHSPSLTQCDTNPTWTGHVPARRQALPPRRWEGLNEGSTPGRQSTTHVGVMTAICLRGHSVVFPGNLCTSNERERIRGELAFPSSEFIAALWPRQASPMTC